MSLFSRVFNTNCHIAPYTSNYTNK